jgi:transcriptional antiterminator NusG
MEPRLSENHALDATEQVAKETASHCAAHTNIAEQQWVLPANYCELRWYAAYTSANHEKRVAEQLRVRSVSHFLPLYASVRQWKDRRVTLQLPLFPGYVFVRTAMRDRLQVQQVPGVAKLVGSNGLPTAISEDEIELLRASLDNGVRAEPHPFLTVGRRVRVMTGPMAGLQGILKRRKGLARLVVSVELIQRAMSVEIDEADVQVIPPRFFQGSRSSEK